MIDQNQSNNQTPHFTSPEVTSIRNYKPYVYVAILALIAVAGLGYYVMPEKYTHQPSSVLEDVPNASSTPVITQPVTPQNPNPVVNPTPEPIACTMDAMMCPDGSYIGRSGPNCEFVCKQNPIIDRAREVLFMLQNKNYSQLEEFISSDGLALNNLPNVNLTKNNVLKKDISDIPNDSKVHLWGYTDGKGDPINLTTKDFIEKWITPELFINADEIVVNKIKDEGTNSLNTVLQDAGNRTVIGFYHASDAAYPGLNWATLYLVFDQENGVYMLRGISRNQWSI